MHDEKRMIDWGRADDPWLFVEDLAAQLAAAAELLRLMTEEGEHAFCEGWSDMTSPGLWRAAVSAETQPEARTGWGYEDTSRAVSFELRRLALEAKCWWIWIGDNVRMVPLSEWEAEHGATPRDERAEAREETER